jgi:hypothetical protein
VPWLPSFIVLFPRLQPFLLLSSSPIFPFQVFLSLPFSLPFPLFSIFLLLSEFSVILLFLPSYVWLPQVFLLGFAFWPTL